MVCQLCNKEIDIEKMDGEKHLDIPLPHTEDMYVHAIAGFAVCLECKGKVTTFFKDLVKG